VKGVATGHGGLSSLGGDVCIANRALACLGGRHDGIA